jgi:hypothetical protein
MGRPGAATPIFVASALGDKRLDTCELALSPPKANTTRYSQILVFTMEEGGLGQTARIYTSVYRLSRFGVKGL